MRRIENHTECAPWEGSPSPRSVSGFTGLDCHHVTTYEYISANLLNDPRPYVRHGSNCGCKLALGRRHYVALERPNLLLDRAGFTLEVSMIARQWIGETRESDADSYGKCASLWDSLDAIKEFAGPDYEKVRYYSETRDFLLSLGPYVRYYEVLVGGVR